MEWKIMSKTEAISETEKWLAMDSSDFESLVNTWNDHIEQNLDDDYLKLRKIVVEAYEKCQKAVNEDTKYALKKEYYLDLLFGLELYRILDDFGFSIRMASNDQVWIFLCVRVFPDLVHRRYPGSKVKTDHGVEQRNINIERFYKTRRRIYLKVLWWYIYLSMQTKNNGELDTDATFEVLKNNSTDEIVQIVERSGKSGYRVGVYRKLMKYYSEHRDKYDNKRFRKVMVLNTARTQLVEPDLMLGGVTTYVKELFDYFDE